MEVPLYTVHVLTLYMYVTRNKHTILWYLPVTLTVPQHTDAFVSSLVHRLLSKNEVAIYFVQAVPQGNHSKLSYRSLTSYTQHSVTAVSKLSSSSQHLLSTFVSPLASPRGQGSM